MAGNNKARVNSPYIIQGANGVNKIGCQLEETAKELRRQTDIALDNWDDDKARAFDNVVEQCEASINQQISVLKDMLPKLKKLYTIVKAYEDQKIGG